MQLRAVRKQVEWQGGAYLPSFNNRNAWDNGGTDVAHCGFYNL